MGFELITALAGFAFVASVTPGPNNFMLLASGANFGFRRTLPHMLGVMIGFAVLVVVVGLGLVRLFDAFPLSYHVLKTVSVAYLLFLAWKIATATAADADKAEHLPAGKPFTFLQAALFQWVNPKAWAVALTALSVYAPPSHRVTGVLLVALVFLVVNVPSMIIWTMLGTQVRRVLTEPTKLRVFNVIIALLLVGTLYPILFTDYAPG